MTTDAVEPSRWSRTVTGDRLVESLGAVNYHEHLFQVSPLLPGDDLDDERASTEEAGHLLASGFTTMIEATPTGLGRNPAGLARVSRRTNLAIVAVTGAHRREHYGNDHWVLSCSTDDLADRFVADIEVGMPTSDSTVRRDCARDTGDRPVRAGVVKAGIGYWRIDDFERRVLEAVARTHTETGAPVMVHLEHGSAAWEVIELLGGLGVPTDAIALAHADRNPDPAEHAELAAAGVYLGYDGFARLRDQTDASLIDCLVSAANRGAAERILVGGDVARRSRYRAYGGMPGLEYVGRRVLPRLASAAPAELLERITVTNPQRYLGRFRRTDPIAPQLH